MRFNPGRCPKCGARPRGIVERLSCLALLFFPRADPEGFNLRERPVAGEDEAEYLGETQVDWDSQETVIDEDGKVTLCCPHHHAWLADFEP